MRIFYLITELDVGGAEKALYELVRRLDRGRFEPVVGCLTGRGEVGDWLRDVGVEVLHFDMRSALDLGVVRRVANAMRRHRSDGVHTFLFHANLIGRVAARLAGVRPVISSVRVEERRRSHLLLDWLTHRLVDVETCVSESTRRYTHERAGIPLDKLVVIPNGVDAARFADPPPPPAEWGLPDDAPVIATVARLDEQKNPMALLAAIADEEGLEGSRPVLAWAGDGPMRGEVEREVARLGLGDRVRLLGRIADVRPLLGRADVFVLASRWEGMPNCVLEAMAAGLPVVATSVGGCPELVEHGETGYLVDPGDTSALSGALCRLLDDADLRLRMGRAARARVRKRFSLDAMAEANVRLYEALSRGA